MEKRVNELYQRAKADEDFITISQLAKEYPIPDDLRVELYEYLIPKVDGIECKAQREIGELTTIEEYLTKFELSKDKIDDAKKTVLYLIHTNPCQYYEEIVLFVLIMEKIMGRIDLPFIQRIYNSYMGFCINLLPRGWHGLLSLTHMILLYYFPDVTIHLDKMKLTTDKLLRRFIFNLNVKMCKDFKAILTLLDGIFTFQNKNLYFYVMVAIYEDMGSQLKTLQTQEEVLNFMASKSYTSDEIKILLSIAKCYLAKSPASFNGLINGCLNNTPQFKQWYTANISEAFVVSLTPTDIINYTILFKQPLQMIDVRPNEQYQHGHLTHAISLEIDNQKKENIEKVFSELTQKQPVVFYASGEGGNPTIKEMAILCYELYSRGYKRVGIMVGGYKMYHKYFIEGSLGFEIEGHNTLKCPACLGVTGGLFSRFKRGEVKENKEVITEGIKDERKTEDETEKKEDDKKEKQENKGETEGKEEDGKIKVEKEHTKSRWGNSFRQTLRWLTEEPNKEKKSNEEKKEEVVKKQEEEKQEENKGESKEENKEEKQEENKGESKEENKEEKQEEVVVSIDTDSIKKSVMSWLVGKPKEQKKEEEELNKKEDKKEQKTSTEKEEAKEEIDKKEEEEKKTVSLEAERKEKEEELEKEKQPTEIESQMKKSTEERKVKDVDVEAQKKKEEEKENINEEEKKATEEEARKRKEEEERKLKEAEEAKKLKEEEARKRKEEEERKRKEEEERKRKEEAKKRKEEEERKLKEAEEARKLKEAEEARKLKEAEEARKRKEEEERKRKEEEEERKRKEEEDKKKAKEAAVAKAKSVNGYCESLMKENKQFKCIRCKGKTKEEAICLVSKEAVVVIIQEREQWEIKDQVMLDDITQIVKVTKIKGQIRIKYGGGEKEKHISLNLGDLVDDFIKEVNSKAN
ncbi:Hypothetical protein EHI5A_090370 [Entamoeba histolytica KU27]|uniref:Rhodanese domain-containing protein n=1 Tax=Entamoeba histolytica KU27 TaxID=885311 RepID=M2S2R2_ENTHI|nr:Hypothetical protein EHI5A_090370 [Entamoeba histolytica KU27]